MRRILHEILTAVLEKHLSGWVGSRIADMGFTPYFSYVLLETGHLGIAYSPGGACKTCLRLDSRPRVEDLLALAWQGSQETSLALAGFSAVTQAWIEDNPGAVKMPQPPMETWLPRMGGTAVLVGYMRGIAEGLGKLGYRVVVVEDDPCLREKALEQGYEALPGSYLDLLEPRLLVASGSSLIDPRLHAYMRRHHESFAVLLGPTATLHPAAANALGFSCVGGSYLGPGRRAEVLRHLKRGAGYHELRRRRLVEKWLACPPRPGLHGWP